MTFSQFPASYAPIGAPLYCALADVTASLVEVRIILSPGILLGTKRFVGQHAPWFDIAPYLAARAEFRPASDVATGTQTAYDRRLMIHLEAEADGEVIRSAPFVVRPARTEEPRSALLTTLPDNRLLAAGESDEVTILAREPQPIKLVATGRDGTIAIEEYILPADTLWRFQVRAADFPEADTLLLDASPAGVIHYTLLAAPEGGCRLAWRNSRGGIDHYTFPVVERVQLTVEKEHCTRESGRQVVRTSSEERLLLRSAYEDERTLRGLSEVLLAEQVWRVTDAGYEAVDVVADAAEIYRHGVLSSLNVTIRSTLKNDRLWS